MEKRQVKKINKKMLFRSNYNEPQKAPVNLKKYFRPLIFILIFIFVIYLVFFSPIFQVGKITVQGKTALPADEIVKQVNQAISASITGRNILLLNTNQVADQIVSQNYQFSNVKINKTFPNGLKVIVTEKQPSIIWKSGSASYVLSEDGRAITDQVANYGNLITINDSANLPVKLGDKVAPASFVTFVLDCLKGLRDKGIKVISMEVPDTTNELYAKTDKGYIIKFDTNKNLNEQLATLDLVLKTLKNKKVSEYIDLRISRRVFYK